MATRKGSKVNVSKVEGSGDPGLFEVAVRGTHAGLTRGLSGALVLAEFHGATVAQLRSWRDRWP